MRLLRLRRPVGDQRASLEEITSFMNGSAPATTKPCYLFQTLVVAMRLLQLRRPVGDQRASLEEITSFMNGSARASLLDLADKSSTTGYLVCEFVKVFVPLRFDPHLRKYAVLRNKPGYVLELVLHYLDSGELEPPIIRTRFYDDMALDMNNALRNLKIDPSDLIVLQNPVVRFNSSSESKDARKNEIEETITIEMGSTRIRGQGNGRVKGQCIDVWHHANDDITKTLAPESVSESSVARVCLQLNIISLTSSKICRFEEEEDGAILSYLIKPFRFWNKEGQTYKALYLFREIYPSGKLNTFFKIMLHGSVAHRFHQALEKKDVVPGDIIAFVNPAIFKIRSVKDPLGESYTLEIGGKQGQKIVLCKKNQQIESTETPLTKTAVTFPVLTCQQKDHKNSATGNSSKCAPVDVRNTNRIETVAELHEMPISTLASVNSSKCAPVDVRNTNRIETVAELHEMPISTLASGNSSKCATVDVRNTNRIETVTGLHKMPISILKPSKNTPVKQQTSLSACISVPKDCNSGNISPDCVENVTRLPSDSLLVPIALVKPSKDELNNQSLNLVSGRCNQFCNRMFMYSEIKWNAKEEPLCPECYVILELQPCLEMIALLLSSGEQVKVILVEKKAENFLQASCRDILNSEEKRMFALKRLAKMCVNSSEYMPDRLRVSDVSFHYML